MTKELHEMTLPELRVEKLAAIAANDRGYADLTRTYIAAAWAAGKGCAERDGRDG